MGIILLVSISRKILILSVSLPHSMKQGNQSSVENKHLVSNVTNLVILQNQYKPRNIKNKTLKCLMIINIISFINIVFKNN